MALSVPPNPPRSATELMEQLAAARGEVAQSVQLSKALRKQALVEGIYQAARIAGEGGDDAQAQALADEADKLSLDLKV